MGVEKQELDKKGQPVLHGADKKCPHGVWQDRRGNSACESCFDDRQTESYLLGIAVGYEQNSGWLRKLSGDMFAHGKDERAKMFRDLADDIAGFAVEKRKEHEKLKGQIENEAKVEAQG